MPLSSDTANECSKRPANESTPWCIRGLPRGRSSYCRRIYRSAQDPLTTGSIPRAHQGSTCRAACVADIRDTARRAHPRDSLSGAGRCCCSIKVHMLIGHRRSPRCTPRSPSLGPLRGPTRPLHRQRARCALLAWQASRPSERPKMVRLHVMAPASPPAIVWPPQRASARLMQVHPAARHAAPGRSSPQPAHGRRRWRPTAAVGRLAWRVRRASAPERRARWTRRTPRSQRRRPVGC